jgi:hypothetical protein
VTTFQLTLFFVALFLLLWGAAFLFGSRRMSRWLNRRARENGGRPTFVTHVTYLRFVGAISIVFAVVAVVVAFSSTL